MSYTVQVPLDVPYTHKAEYEKNIRIATQDTAG